MPTAATAGDFGSGVSPIIADGKAIVVRDQMKDAKIVALDLANGSLAWETPRSPPRRTARPWLGIRRPASKWRLPGTRG